MGDHVIGTVDDFSEGDRMLVELKGREIGIFYIDGEFYAYINWCVHQGGPVCEGGTSGHQKAAYNKDELELELEWSEDPILACPWHDWEFDLKTGKHTTRQDIELPSYPVRVEDEEIIITI